MTGRLYTQQKGGTNESTIATKEPKTVDRVFLPIVYEGSRFASVIGKCAIKRA